MKFRFVIVLALLSGCLLSCSSEPTSPTSPSEALSVTTPAAPSVTTELPSPALTTTAPQGEPATSRLPVTTSKPDGDIVIDGWGTAKFILAHVCWDDECCGTVIDEGALLELKLRVGHPLTVYGEVAVKDTSAPMELKFTFDGEGELLPGNQYVIEDFWTNPIYMLHPYETKPFEVACEISVVLNTSALTLDEGEISFAYAAEEHTSRLITIRYEKRDGKIVFCHSSKENAMDMIYDQYCRQ